MKNKYVYTGIGIVIFLLLIFTVPKYMNGNVTASGAEISGDIEKIEVFHFHSTNQCASCIAVGALAKETLNTYFTDELESEKIIFESINIEWPKNFEIVEKYGATGSSLLIGVYYLDGSFTKEENVNVWYKIKDKESYMNYLKQVLETKLSGE